MNVNRSKFVLVVAVVSVGLLVAVLLHLDILGGHSYGHRAAGASRVLQEAEGVLREIAAEPTRVAEYVSPSATERARKAIRSVARDISTWESPQVSGAEWFGEFLRVRVAGTGPEGGTVEHYLYMVKEAGELRITGVEH